MMNNNYGKGNLVDAVLKLLLSSENLSALDDTLVTLFSEISQFDEMVDNLEHKEKNPEMFSIEEQIRGYDTSLDEYKNLKGKLKSIQKLIKMSQKEMEKEKQNLVKVHQIYVEKFKKKMGSSQTNLDEKSKRILMESLMNSHHKSFAKPKQLREADKSAEETDIKETKSLSEMSKKTEEVKQMIDKASPEKKEAIIKSLEIRKKVLEA